MASKTISRPAVRSIKEIRSIYAEHSNNIHFEAELVVKIKKIGKNIAANFAHKYYDEIGLGIDFTARDLQEESARNQ